MTGMERPVRRFLRRDYAGKKIRVSFDHKRCLHAEECVRRAPAVFDRNRVPWIDPDGAGAGQVIAAVLACPTGALRYELPDGSQPEEAPGSNMVFAMQDGPLYLRGRVVIVSEAGQVLHSDYRAALCRCGSSENKPFCDNSHRKTGFRAPGLGGSVAGMHGKPSDERLVVTPLQDASFLVRGQVTILTVDGDASVEVRRPIKLCRCGG